nr:ubiquitin hydrolase [Tanacetum cinerariifolium]
MKHTQPTPLFPATSRPPPATNVAAGKLFRRTPKTLPSSRSIRSTTPLSTTRRRHVLNQHYSRHFTPTISSPCNAPTTATTKGCVGFIIPAKVRFGFDYSTKGVSGSTSKALGRSEKVKEGVGYNAVPPPAVDLYLSPKKDLSWTGLPEFVDDTPKDSQPESKSKEQETPKKSQVKYPEQNRHSNKRPKGNQKNWNNLKSYQLGLEFVLHKKPCYNCGDFSHLANDCRRKVQMETNRSQNHSYKTSTHRSSGHRPNGTHMRPPHRSSGPRPHRDSMRPTFRPAGHRPHGPSMNPRRPTMNGARPYKSSF